MAAQRTYGNFAYDHPALVATVLTLAVVAAFLGAIYASVSGHHGGEGEHGASSAHAGSAHPSSAHAATSGAPSGAPSAHAK